MKKMWNKETRNEENFYYRIDDWGVIVDDDSNKENFTNISPPQEAFDGVPCDWNGEAWVLKEEEVWEMLRKKEYPKIEDLVVALWERVMENKTLSSDALQVKREDVKTRYPKNLNNLSK